MSDEVAANGYRGFVLGGEDAPEQGSLIASGVG